MLFAPSPTQAPPGELRERFAAAGQAHVFRFWDALDAAGRARLAAQAERIDPDALRRAFAQATAPSPVHRPVARTEAPEPPEVERHPARGGDPAPFARAREAGEAWLADGRVAAVVVAGGQGSRLGLDGPKGALPIGPVSGRSLFALQAQRLRGLARRLGRPVPWLVMTSDATDAATRALFAREGHFGLASEDVRFFRQASLPVLDPRGGMLLAAPDRIAEAPAGHGGVMPALVAEGVLAEMEARGVEALFHYQVDNP
ncbi:MAG: UTP--glucose-1-phosphate uridylyltransferase, partial [Myxococcota bacterium]|nr:UTP--glucose-1-phosphate uridylyltransferase [Myxococcota bacterium]